MGLALDQLRKDCKLIDLTIICGQKSFYAHRVILCSCSTFFENILVPDSQNPTSTVDLEDVAADVMEVLLEFMYKGIIEITAPDADQIIHIMTTAHLLAINGAASYFCDLLLKLKPHKSISLLWDWASEFENADVESTIIMYIVNNIGSLWKSSDFIALTSVQFNAVMCQIYKNKTISADVIVRAVLAWVKHDQAKRCRLLMCLAAHIPFHNISESYAKYLLREEVILQRFPEVMKLLQDAKDSKIKKNSELVVDIGTIGNKVEEEGIKDPDSTKLEISRKKMEKFSLKTSSKYLETFSEAVCHNQGPVILLTGGDDRNRTVVHVFVPEKAIWSMSEEVGIPVLENRGHAYHKGNIYYMGGEERKDSVSCDLYIFNIKTLKLNTGPKLRVPRSHPGIGQYQHLIYLAGGTSRFGSPLTHVECFDCLQESWKLIPSLREKRESPGIAVIDGFVYVIGGATNRCEMYDGKKDMWQDIIPLPEQYRDTYMVTAVHNDKVYAFRHYKPDRICCFDPQKNEWRTIKTTGPSPSDIIGLHNKSGEFWALCKTGRLFVFDVENFSWEVSIVCPKSITRPMFMTIVDLEELEYYE